MGNPYGRNGQPAVTLEARIAQSVKQDGSCLVWTGSVVSRQDGRYCYGRIYVRGEQKFVHRVVWELRNGPIPDGHEIGRTCRNTLCVAADHMFTFYSGKSGGEAEPLVIEGNHAERH